MKRNLTRRVLVLCLAMIAAIAAAQTQQPEPAANVISGTVAAIGYPVGGGSIEVDMVGTQAASQASGEAKVEAKTGGTTVELKVAGMPQPTSIGAEFLTYILWTVTPDGTTSNLGQIPMNQNGEGKLNVRAQAQTFALIVTAEPYYAVRMPSEVVVLVNETRKKTKGKIYPDNSYRLMKRGEYAKLGNPLGMTLDLKKVPLDMYEARNAVEIAKARGAEQYAAQVYSKATSSLQMAENALTDSGKNQVISAARQTIQFAEDARALAVQRETAERIQKEKEVAAADAAAKAKAEADARAAAEAQRQAELTAAKEAQMKAEAQAQAAEAKAAADAAAAKAAAEQAATQARAQAASEEAARAQAQTAALRAQLLRQLNDVLQTTDTPRGLVVNMADVLFETGKYALSTDAQLKLAKLSGIIQAHAGLNLAIEGYTDTTGTADFNMKLSQQRADGVRQFLVTQGLSADAITSKGLGEADPIADNSTAAGRKLNRRVEIIVSGKAIGVSLGK
ncbi:MAG TPA: OmpA family protein [Candidatus Acidoferrum sp.]|jgi:outer membrane protein OmpA-like peptidoglycan-associated protein